MKKKFSARGVSSIIRIICSALIIGFFLGLFIYFVVDLCNGNNNVAVWVLAIIAFLCAVIFFVALILSFHNKIIFFEDKIVVTGEINEKGVKSQYKDEIFFKDIENIKIVVSRNQNSLKKWYPATENHYVVREKKPFFEFILKEQESKWVCVYDFSIKQRKEMLKIINERTGLNIDYDNIYSKREEIDVGRTY